GVDLRSVSLLGNGPVAWAAIIPDDAAVTRDVLRATGYRYVEGEQLVVEVEDRPGGLADVAERLAAAGVSILGSIVVSQRPGAVRLALTVDDEAKARGALVFTQLPNGAGR
ncbi:MAG TPA: ACT domain-containing protein, partial [Candidatus Binatus sp.]|nr:ACT domain-containing protein [Candidatus Binatus sp.]